MLKNRRGGTPSVNEIRPPRKAVRGAWTWLAVFGLLASFISVTQPIGAQAEPGDVVLDAAGDVQSNCVTGFEDGCSTWLQLDSKAFTIFKSVQEVPLDSSASSTDTTVATYSPVRPGRVIQYSITRFNTGGQDLTANDEIVDDLSQVLSNATLVPSSISAKMYTDASQKQQATGTVPQPQYSAIDKTLTWFGTQAGVTRDDTDPAHPKLVSAPVVVITYQVQVNDTVAPDQILHNVVSGCDSDYVGRSDANGTAAYYLDNNGPGGSARYIIGYANPQDGASEPIFAVEPTKVTSTCTVNVPISQTELQVSKTSNPVSGSTVVAGQTVTYTLTAKNSGDIDLTNVTLTDDLASVLPYADLASGPTASPNSGNISTANNKVTWTGDLAANQTVTVTYSVKVHSDLDKSDILKNQVTGSATDPNDPRPVPSSCVDGTEDGCYSTLTPSLPGLTIKKISDPASGGIAPTGSQVTYTLTGENSGNADLNVTLTDNLSDVLDNADIDTTSLSATIDGAPAAVPTLQGTTLTWTGLVAAGKTVTVTYKVTVKKEALVTDTIKNSVTGSATVPGNPDEDVPATCDPCSSTLTPGVGHLNTTKTSDSGFYVNPGQVINYTITGVSDGNADFNDSVKDDLTQMASDSTYVAGSAIVKVNNQTMTAPTFANNELTWTGIVPVGQTFTMTYQVKVNDDTAIGTPLKNCVTAGDQEPVCYTPGVGALNIKKVSSPESGSKVNAGDTVTYTLTAENVGQPGAPMLHATLTDDLSGVLPYAAQKGAPTATINSQPVAAPTITNNVLSWNGDLAVGQTVIVTYSVTVNADLTLSDTLKNKVTGSAPNPDKPGEDVHSTCVTGEEPGCSSILTPNVTGWTFTKTSDAGRYVTPGQAITYTLKGVNSGNVDLTKTVTDDMAMLAHATVVQAPVATIDGQPVSGLTVSEASGLTWTGTVPAGKTLLITYQVKVNDNVAVDDQLTNCAFDGDTEVCVVLYGGALDISKVSNPANGQTVAAGQTVTYTLTAKNVGDPTKDAPTLDATLTDDLSGVLSHATLVPGPITAMMDNQAAGTVNVSSANVLSWAGSIAAGKTVTITYSVVVKDGLALSDTLRNKVIGSAPDPDDPTKTVPSTCQTGTEEGCYSELTPDVTGWNQSKTSDPEFSTAPGQVVTYTITGSNTGNTDVVKAVTDDMSDVLNNAAYTTPAVAMIDGQVVTPAPVLSSSNVLSWTGTVPAGSMLVISYQVTVNPDVKIGTLLHNEVTSCPPDSTGDECVPTPHTLPVGDLLVVKTSVPATGSRVNANDTVSYTVTAQNLGQKAQDADHVDAPTLTATVTDDLSRVLSGATLVGNPVATINGQPASVAATYDATTHVVSWMGPLTAQQTVTITYQVKVNSGLTTADVLRNKVVGSAPNPDPAHQGENVISSCVTGTEEGCYSELTPDVTSWNQSKTSDPEFSTAPGQVVTYTITGSNTGNTDVVKAVSDDLSGVLDYATYTTPAVATIDGQVVTPAPVLSGDVVSWTGTVPAGKSVVVVYKVTVNTDVKIGTVLHNKVTSCPPDSTEEGCVPTDVYLPVGDLLVVKTSDPETGSRVNANDTVSYTVKAQNLGLKAQDANHLDAPTLTATVTDDLSDVLSHATLVSQPVAMINGQLASVAATYDATTHVVLWKGELTAQQTVTITYQVKVNSGLTTADVLRNKVVGSAPNPDPKHTGENVISSCPTGAEEGCYSELTPDVTGFKLSKTSSPSGSVSRGQTVTYSVTGANTGNNDYTAGLTDDVSGVLKYADYVAGSAIAKVDGVTSPVAPELSADGKVTWSGSVPGGKTVVMTYQMTVKDDVTVVPVGTILINTVNMQLVPDKCKDNPDLPECISSPETCLENPYLPECPTPPPVVHELPVGTLEMLKTSSPADGSRVNAGQTVSYTLTAKNIGLKAQNTDELDAPSVEATVSDDLSSVVSHAELATGPFTATINNQPAVPATATYDPSTHVLSWKGMLAPQETVTIHYSVVVNSNLTAVDVLKNKVTGAAFDPAHPDTPLDVTCVTGDEPGCSSTLTLNVSNLKVVKTSDAGRSVAPGQVVTYTVTGSNTGNVDIDNAQVSDDLTNILNNATYTTPAVATIDGQVVTPAPVLSGDKVTWTGKLSAGKSVVMTYKVTVNPDTTIGTVLTNTACVADTSVIDPTAPQNCVTVTTPVGDLLVLKTSDPADGSRVNANQTVSYMLTAKNVGDPAKNAPAFVATVTDDLSGVVSYADLVAGPYVATIDGQPAVPATATYNPTTHVMSWTGSLAAQQTVTVKYSVVVKSGLMATNVLKNKVIGTAPDPDDSTKNVISSCVTGLEAGCSSTLTPTPVRLFTWSKVSNPSSVVGRGKTVTYTVSGTNNGNVAYDATMKDDLSGVLAYADFVSGSVQVAVDGQVQSPAPQVAADQTLTWTGIVPAGKTVVMTYQVTVKADVEIGTMVTNVMTPVIQPVDCTTNPELPQCQPCAVDPTLPECQPCSVNPDAPECQPCYLNPGSPECNPNPTCEDDPTLDGCPVPHTIPVGPLQMSKVSVPADGSRVTAGQIVNYTLTAMNNGLMAQNVDQEDAPPIEATITDDLSGVLSHAVLQGNPVAQVNGKATSIPVTVTGTTLTWKGTLAAQDTVVITYSVKVNTGLTTADVLKNKVTGTAPDPDNPGQNVDSSCITGLEEGCSSTLTPSALALSKVASPAGYVAPGGVLTYTLTGENKDTKDYTGIVSDNLSSVLNHAVMTGTPTAKIDGVAVTAPVVDGMALTWTGTVPAGKSVVIVYQVTINADTEFGTVLHNSATVDCDPAVDAACPPTERPCNPDIEICVTTTVGALDVSKTSDPASGSIVTAGQTVTYTLTSTNVGDLETAKTLTATLTDDLSNVLNHATLKGTPTATIDGVAVAAPTRTGNVLTWTGPLAAGKTVIVTYAVTVNSDVTVADTLQNKVIASAPNPDEPDQKVPSKCETGTEPGCSSILTPGVPNISWTKVSDPKFSVAPGDQFTYTITGANTGNADGIATVSDSMAAMADWASYVAGSAVAKVNDVVSTIVPVMSNDNVLTWTGNVPAGQSLVITYQAKVNDDTAFGTVLKNVVTTSVIPNPKTYCDEHPDDPICVTTPTPPTPPPAIYCDEHPDDPICVIAEIPVGQLKVSKVSDPVSGSRVIAGQTVKYTLTAQNLGLASNGAPALEATLSDDLTNVLSYAAISSTSYPVMIDGQSIGTATVSGDKVLSWTGNIPAGKTATVSYQVTVNSGLTIDNVLTNKVTGTAPNPEKPGQNVPSTCPTGNEPGCSSTLTPNVTGWVVTKVADPTGYVDPGQTINYTITGTNSGNVPLTRTLVDDLSDAVNSADFVTTSPAATIDGVAVAAPTLSGDGKTLTWTGAIPAGKSVVITYRMIVRADAEIGDTIENCVKTLEEPDVPQVCSVPPIPLGGLKVTKTSDPETGSRVIAGQTVTYTLTAEDYGDSDFSPVNLTDDLSQVLAYGTLVAGPIPVTMGGQAANPATATVSGTTLSWTGTIPAHQTVTMVYQVIINQTVETAPAGTALKNAVRGSATDVDRPNRQVRSSCVTGNETGCSSTLYPPQAPPNPPTTSFVVSKVSDPSSDVRPGQVVTYTVTGQNNGSADIASANVTDNMTGVLIAGTLDKDSLVAKVNNQVVSAPVLSDSGQTWTWTGPVPQGQSVVVTYTVTVNSDAQPGVVLRNNVTSTTPGTSCATPDNPGCTNEIHVVDTGLQISKASNPVSGSKVYAGQTVTYTLTAKNKSNTAYNPVILSDDLSSVLNYAELSGNSFPVMIDGQSVGNMTLSGKTLSWTGTIPASKTATVTYSVVVAQTIETAPAGTVLKNAVTGSGKNPDNPNEQVPSTCVTGNEPGCSSILVPGITGYDISKVSDPVDGSIVSQGQLITYTLTGTNSGSVNIDAQLADDLTNVLTQANYVDGSATATIDGQSASGLTKTDTAVSWSGVLTPGKTVVVQYSVRIKADATVESNVTNKVTGQAQNPDNPGKPIVVKCVTGNEPGCSSSVKVGQGKLAINKLSTPASGSQITAGETLEYLLTAQNIGDLNLSPVTLTDDLSGVLSQGKISEGSLAALVGGQLAAPPTISSANVLTWTGALPVGQTVLVSYKVQINSDVTVGGHLVNKVTGTGIDPRNPNGQTITNCVLGTEPGCFSDVTLVPKNVGNLETSKTSDPANGSVVTAGQVVQYTLTGRNTGDFDYAVTLSDDLTNVVNHAKLDSASMIAKIDGKAVAAPTLTGSVLTWTGAVPAGKTVTVTYQATVNTDVKMSDTLTNKVTSSANIPGIPGQNVPSTCVTGTEPGCQSILHGGEGYLETHKDSNPATGSTAAPGSTITYTLRATNTGNARVDTVSLVDDMADVLDNATMVPGSVSATIDGVPTTAPSFVGTTLMWMGSLDSTQTVTVEYTVTVKDNVAVNDVLANRLASEGRTPGNPNPVPSTCVTGDEPGCSSIITPNLPKLVVLKAADVTSAASGSMITYTITGQNVSSMDMVATVNDDLSSVLRYGTLVVTSVRASIDGKTVDAPVLSGNVMTWTGQLDAGKTVVVTYQVIVNSGLTAAVDVTNRVTATGNIPGIPGAQNPSTCQTGQEPGCYATVTYQPGTTPRVATGGTSIAHPWTAKEILPLMGVLTGTLLAYFGTRRILVRR